jgi:hypothetical protein
VEDCREAREVLECGRCYDILIKDQKLEHKGKLAEIEGEDGIFANDTVNMGANKENIKDREIVPGSAG